MCMVGGSNGRGRRRGGESSSSADAGYKGERGGLFTPASEMRRGRKEVERAAAFPSLHNPGRRRSAGLFGWLVPSRGREGGRQVLSIVEGDVCSRLGKMPGVLLFFAMRGEGGVRMWRG